MRIMLLAALALAGWTLGSEPARADDNQGFYLGGGVGRYDIAIHNAADLGNTIDNYSANDTAYQFFGGWRFAPFVALEASYLNLGTNRSDFGAGTQLTNKIYGWAPWLVFSLPLGSAQGTPIGPFELFAKAGEYWYRYHRDYITPVGESESASDTFNHFVYGGGVGLVVLQRVGVRLEYDELKIQNTSTSNALWLTAEFRF
ncbi:MAG: outer membrane beta-barrel protein [Steroidobacteraceae bacterium]